MPLFCLPSPSGTQRGPSPVFAQTPDKVTGISGSATGATSATVTVLLNNPDSESVTVYLQYGVGGSYDKEASDSTSGEQIQFTLEGLSQGTIYGIRASSNDADPFVAGATGTFTTGTPSITTVAHSEVDDDSAKITVTVAYPNGNSVNLRYKKTDEADSTYQAATAQTTTETDDSQALVFTLGSLTHSTGYTVQAKLDSSDFTSGTIVSDTFTTAVPPPAIEDVAESEVDHNSAKITVTVSNPNSTTVYLRHKKTPEADSTYSSPTPKTTTTTGASEDVVFELSGLAASTGYTVQAKLVDNDFTTGTITFHTFTTAPHRPPSRA